MSGRISIILTLIAASMDAIYKELSKHKFNRDKGIDKQQFQRADQETFVRVLVRTVYSPTVAKHSGPILTHCGLKVVH